MMIIKSYTDLGQSKKLSDILSLDSADMCFVNDGTAVKIDANPYLVRKKMWQDVEIIPCWSLAALLKILPLPTIEETMITTTETKWKCTIYCESHAEYWSELHNDAIDAAFEMVCWLKENGKI